LTRSHEVDASNIEVAVSEGNVILSGTVHDRQSKRVAEDLAQDVWGAKDVQNQIRVESGVTTEQNRTSQGEQATTSSSGSAVRTATAATGPLGLSGDTGRR
jgi:Flp pilus assembly secretin CpaC